MNWTKVAQEAYEAYGRRTDFKNFQGNPMPKWEDLPPIIKEAWIVASRQAVASVNRIILEPI